VAPAATPAPDAVVTVAATTDVGRLGLPIAFSLAVLLVVFGAGLRWGDAVAARTVRLASAGTARWRASRGRRARR
jgi:hypothetical protein